MTEEGKPCLTREILVVDDDTTQLHLLSLLLEAHGFDVTAASDGSRALEILKGSRFRIMITDLNMPGMNGIELATRVRALDAGTHVVLVTAELELVDDALGAGISRIFKKPVNVKRLVASIRSALA